jgi:hypothetical protein
MIAGYLCPVCGYPALTATPWDDDVASDEICPSCGTHFGYDDVAGGDSARRIRIWRERRDAWKSNGLRWFSKGVPQPPNWNPCAQLVAVEER